MTQQMTSDRQGASGVRRIANWKRLAFGLVAAVGTYACIELISVTVLVAHYGGISTNDARQSQAARADALDTGPLRPIDTLHPYLGYVRQPRTDDNQVSQWGFHDRRSPIHQRSSRKVIIGILGGSVAEEFADGAGQRLCEALRRAPRFADKEIVIVHLALAGYKQPQQLMVINYLTSLGGEFDVLLNIDGFNEVALPAAANVPNGVFTSYPFNWQTRVTESTDPAILRVVGRITVRKELSQAWAARMTASPARYSATLNLIWHAYDDALWNGIFRDHGLLGKMLPAHTSYCATGPPQKFANAADLYAHCAGIWMRSSAQLHQLAAGGGILYFHFLQPNQYVPGSKDMGSEERHLAIAAWHDYRAHVEGGYPWLQRFGARLREQGVRFRDLTQLFADEKLPTYRDDCCHYNQRGNELLADEIARTIVADSSASRP